MTANREREVTQALVSLASSLAKGYDVLDFLNELTEDCARLLDVNSAGLLLADRLGVLHVMAASSANTRRLEAYQLQRAEGPCLDCYREGTPVAIADLETAQSRWPQFAPAALASGVHSVHALPMRFRDSVIGALGLFGTTVGELNSDDLSLAQALADVATVALVQDQTDVDRTAVNAQLQTALSSRVVLEQAKGVLAQRTGVDMGQALSVLRQYAQTHDLRLTYVAQSVVSTAARQKA